MASRRAWATFIWTALLTVLSVTMMIVDHRSNTLQPVRTALAYITQPLQSLATLPSYLSDWVSTFKIPESQWQNAYQRLRDEHVQLQAKLQKFAALEGENKRLNKLLGISNRLTEEVLLAQIINVSLDPFTHKVVVNRGHRDGVYVGQAVIDPKGIVGQVTNTTLHTSSVTLLTDASHAIPVQVQRNGLLTVVYGLGVSDKLSIPYLALHAEIQEGDLLVTSGMGGRFPRGHPVARVTTIVKDANEAFLGVSAKPVARLDYAKELLLLWQNPGDDIREILND